MDFLREIVSGPKHRYRQDGYNLDLTYITPRIIAMAYPAEGVQKLYRNSIDTVRQFLEKHHKNKYQIINVSGRDINEEKLSNIESFFWEDHKTPQFQTLFVICQRIMDHLLKNTQNVSVRHCNHGKGRTGTLICCFMLFTGYFKEAHQAMKFYEKQRFQKEGYGVTQPCQIKYIEYFNQILKKPRMFPMVLSLYKISIKGKHSLESPYFKLKGVQHDGYFMSTKDQNMEVLEIEKANELLFKIRKDSYFFGDCVLEIKHKPVMGKKVAANFSFNTAFLNDSYKHVEVKLFQLSPLSSVKSGIFEKNFTLTLTFKRLCHCDGGTHFEERCQKCKSYLSQQSKKWQIIYQAIQSKPKVDCKLVLFGKNSSE